MNQFEFFMESEEFFKNVKNIFSKFDFKIIFRRYETNKHEAGYLNVNIDDDLHQLYLDGGYCEVFLSIGAIPKKSQDWDFYEDNFKDLIEILGGRQTRTLLEYFAMRLIAKKSNANKLYGALKRLLKSKMEFGDLYVGATNYSKIYYDPNVINRYTLTNDINDKDFIFCYRNK